ncbi:hypothetical protein A3G67_01940 [Candidatus Roizmanbacteria bacterium RIFCSPLOWO2_12_FULL_40_12]|uniref:Uncharacterized protein n=1 Tax=Candidatus Roizmanbacteria bacterium RIFCSPLOWO2_01_FULL_40_42 TaxID=1802066 RepID=A0A1F7J3K6_9BACT|nr:MAG: hypothetical protein A2779_01060 [Candidatus Roizmanbacteria bacterium RIFCSPHIGHO2_01_FULL_40_98]OGK28956.1 MAG: hypothetical protein A3C31_01700 [Candidatus Roizmanbacteria bacterium RIFCSPHIGHO2_02_FULL_40_53]OGK29578.1 MAG: hypothetical protein A2W49_03840 [Candidatus Roizmanbacteria bacterium RIFCSPHIGHO2_12_41_18]OGK37243.1 MAG: hypothetical protein A3E69_04000 [Candidatus Roizmanbacteria bacterium RIFCSPHIGHO2_12_FULL_40_130]OGK50185.1 MAG: hypothetical protein A3B50_00155 [Candi
MPERDRRRPTPVEYLTSRLRQLPQVFPPRTISFDDIVKRGEDSELLDEGRPPILVHDDSFDEVDSFELARATSVADFFLPSSFNRTIHLQQGSASILDHGSIVDLILDANSTVVISPYVDVVTVRDADRDVTVWHHPTTVVLPGDGVDIHPTVYGDEANFNGHRIDPDNLTQLKRARFAVADGVQRAAVGEDGFDPKNMQNSKAW